MKQGSTLFLKFVIFLLAALVLGVCVFGLPPLISSDRTGNYRPILLGMYVSAIPFFLALFQTFKLLGYIDKNKAFSDLSIKTLRYIKYCAISISVFYAVEMPYIYIVAEKDDAPGVILIGLVIVFASLVIATFAAVLQKLIQNAVDIKSENDLTV